MGVACHLLRGEPVDGSAEHDGNEDCDRGAVRVPVADVAAHGRPDHIALASPSTIECMAVRCGIAGWIDKSLLDSKVFYPMNAKTSEERLNFYASQFSLVEVDSTYYGLP